MKKFVKKYALIILLVLAFLLRLISLSQSLWHDESGTVIAARDTNFLRLVTTYSEGDFHPPGYFVILLGWIKVFGDSEVATRFPSVVFGVATVFLTYLLGKKIFSKEVGILGALLLTISPLHIYYSQEARMYSFAAFAVALSIYGFVKLISKERYGAFIFTLGTILVLYSDYIAYLIIPAQILYLLFYKREKIRSFFVPYLFGLLALIPWFFVFPKQLEIGLKTAKNFTGWSDVVGGISLKSLGVFLAKIVVGRISFDNKYLYALIVGVIFLIFTYLFLYVFKRRSSKAQLLLFCLFVPVVLGIGVSFFIPVFSYFRYLFILPFLYLLLGWGLWGGKFMGIFLGVILLVEIYSSGQYLLNPSNQREDWKSAVAFADSMDTSKTLVLFKDVKVLSSYRYYTKKGSNAHRGFLYIPVKNFYSLEQTNYKEVQRVILFEYLTDITDPNRILEKKIANEGFNEKETMDFRGVGFVRVYDR